jgi:hypothetical protein
MLSLPTLVGELNVEYGMWNMDCCIWNVAYGMLHMECEM